jgi:UDP-N-acetylmuramoyl-tripeptide--D-alanyl-D-alanine ligase
MIPFELAVRATGARFVGADRAPTALRVATDTRSIEPGDAFLALRGERFDGHAYTREAVARGAAALIVDERSAAVAGVTTLIVPNTLRAYLALARVARDRFGGRVVAITGSAGKTTTKELLAQLMRAHYGDRVAASPANENNEIGVSKFLLGHADARRDVLVVEMGARHYDDIAPLVEAARPDLGILTNVGEAHIEIMGSRERLAHTKWGLFSGGARAVLNARDDVSLARAPSLPRTPHWFAAIAEGERISTGGTTTLLVGANRLIEIDGDRVVERAIDVRLPGVHNRANLAGAIAAALDLGVPVESILATVPLASLPKGRYEAIDLPGRPRLIYDAYNANLSGMLAALDAFAGEAGERRIAVLASMAELGDEAPAMHERVGERAAAAVDLLLVGGRYADELARGAAAGGLSSERIVRFASNDEAARWIDASGRPGDVVLLKGSRVYALEEIVERLRT